METPSINLLLMLKSIPDVKKSVPAKNLITFRNFGISFIVIAISATLRFPYSKVTAIDL